MGFTVTLDSGTQSDLRSIAGSLAGLVNAAAAQNVTLAAIAKSISTPPVPVAVRIRLALPTISKKGVIMANFELANDEVATIPILIDDAAGNPVPAPAGDTFTVTSSLPASLGAAISGSNVVLTPLVQASPGITITVSDSAGLTSFAQLVDIVQDLTPKAITLNLAAATEASQAVPTAPGP